MIYYLDSSCLVKRYVKELGPHILLDDKKHSSPISWSSPRLVMVGVSLDF